MGQTKRGSILVLMGLCVGIPGAGCGADKDSGLPEGMGAVSFWTDREECGGVAHEFCVVVDGAAGRRCASTQDQAPRCGAPRTAASFALTPGDVDFDASVVAGELIGDWKGTVTIVEGACQLVQLECV